MSKTKYDYRNWLKNFKLGSVYNLFSGEAMKNIYKFITLALGLSFLAGCSTYAPPVSGPTAIVTTADSEATIGIYKNANECKDYTSLSYRVFSGGNIPVKVSTGKLVTFKISMNTTDYACTSTVFSFVPEENNQYQIEYAPKPQEIVRAMFEMGKRDCILQVTNLTTNRKVKFYLRDYQESIVLGKSSCTPLKN